MSDTESEKTGRIAMLCVTMVILGFFLFLFKVEACSGCGKPDTTPPVCKDEFYEIKNDGYASNHTCYPGAHAEVVSSPPAPKPGVLCHCDRPGVKPDAGAQ